MKNKKFKQSDYMALQLREIENFRMSIARESRNAISFQEATILWISEGHAESFRAGYGRIRAVQEPALA